MMMNSAWSLMAISEQMSTVTMCTKNEVWSSKNEATMMGTSPKGITYNMLYLNLTHRKATMTKTVMNAMRNTMRRMLEKTLLRCSFMKK